MPQRPHWSSSALQQYLACPLRYYFQRVLGLPARTAPAHLVLGSAVHAALAEYHRGLLLGRQVKLDHLREVLLETWGAREKEQTVTFRDGESRADLLAQGEALLAAYLQEDPPEGIVAVEHEVLAPVQNSRGEYLETPLVAVTDLLTHPGAAYRVFEFKTSGRALSTSEAATALQPTCYVNAVQAVFGAPAVVEYVVLVKTRTPKVQRLTATRSDEDLGRLGDLIQAVERAVEAAVFYPVESPLNCSGCPYRGPCRSWRGPATSQEEPGRVALPIISGDTRPSPG
ncbi:MAG: PD-(D/E)XK nuclease family protein [Gemmataceae bacterium]|nr:PD-(D/E)XK nuclease family protein [Gemmataceae bacterium]